ncbi:hypothetical protein ACQJBY_049024 [Aegilops geniculata]
MLPIRWSDALLRIMRFLHHTSCISGHTRIRRPPLRGATLLPAAMTTAAAGQQRGLPTGHGPQARAPPLRPAPASGSACRARLQLRLVHRRPCQLQASACCAPRTAPCARPAPALQPGRHRFTQAALSPRLRRAVRPLWPPRPWPGARQPPGRRVRPTCGCMLRAASTTRPASGRLLARPPRVRPRPGAPRRFRARQPAPAPVRLLREPGPGRL